MIRPQTTVVHLSTGEPVVLEPRPWLSAYFASPEAQAATDWVAQHDCTVELVSGSLEPIGETFAHTYIRGLPALGVNDRVPRILELPKTCCVAGCALTIESENHGLLRTSMPHVGPIVLPERHTTTVQVLWSDGTPAEGLEVSHQGIGCSGCSDTWTDAQGQVEFPLETGQASQIWVAPFGFETLEPERIPWPPPESITFTLQQVHDGLVLARSDRSLGTEIWVVSEHLHPELHRGQGVSTAELAGVDLAPLVLLWPESVAWLHDTFPGEVALRFDD